MFLSFPHAGYWETLLGGSKKHRAEETRGRTE